MPSKHMTIDKHMIRYMGHASSYLQYMPAKPIEHGIQAFALCCTLLAVILSFKVYFGKEDVSNRTAVGVYNHLVVDAGLAKQRGRILYTDNYYTSVKLAIHMFEKFGWTMVGTISLTDKKSWEDQDIPFIKLSNGTHLGVEHGWFHEAVTQLKSPTGKTYYIVYTTWQDKKQVCFLHNCNVESSIGLSVMRRVKGKICVLALKDQNSESTIRKLFPCGRSE